MSTSTREVEARNGPWLGLALLVCITVPTVLALQGCGSTGIHDQAQVDNNTHVIIFFQGKSGDQVCLDFRYVPGPTMPRVKADYEVVFVNFSPWILVSGPFKSLTPQNSVRLVPKGAASGTVGQNTSGAAVTEYFIVKVDQQSSVRPCWPDGQNNGPGMIIEKSR